MPVLDADGLALLPTGLIFLYAGSDLPSGCLELDGSAVSRTLYAALFDKYGTTWGAGNGTTTFNLPDMRDRVPMGASGTKALGTTNAGGHSHSHNHAFGTLAAGANSGVTHTLNAHTHADSHTHGFASGFTTPSGPTTGGPTSTAGRAAASAPNASPGGQNHTHTMTGNNHAHTVSSGASNSGGLASDSTTTDAPTHQHSGTWTGTASTDATSSTDLPPWQALRFLVRT